MTARLTREALHVLVQTAGEPDATGRLTRLALHALLDSPTRLDTPSLSVGMLMQAVLQEQAPASADVFVTEADAQALVFAPEGEIGVRVSQLTAEPLSTPVDTAVRVSQLAAEVLHVPDFATLCPTFPVVFKLRIEGEGGDLLTVTSYSDGGALIAEAPRVDGQTFDPLTGKTTIGQANVLIIDATEHPCSDGGTYDYRYVTAILADEYGNSQLLGKRAYLEIARDLTTLAYEPYFAGYISSVRLVDGITYEVGLSHTTRDDETTEVWATSDYPYARTASYLVGGPVEYDVPADDPAMAYKKFEGYWKATVKGIYDTFVHLDIDEDDCLGFPPSDIKPYMSDPNKGWFFFSNNDAFQKDVFRWAQGNAQKYFVRGFPSTAAETEWTTNPTGKDSIRGYMPRLLVDVKEVNGSPVSLSFPMMASYERFDNRAQVTVDTLCWENLGNHFYVNWPDADTVNYLAVDDQISFAIRAIDVSEAAPLWLSGHPVDLVADLLLSTGATVNLDTSASAPITAAKDGVGDFLVSMRIVKPQTVAQALAMLCGAFGLGVRVEDDGSRTIFCWRTRREPVATITLDDLVAPAAVWWSTDEASKLHSIEWKFRRYDAWPGQDQPESPGDRAFDGMVAFEETPIRFDVGQSQAKKRTETYDVDGVLLSGYLGTGRRLVSLIDVCAVWSDQTFGVFANGAVTTEIEVFHELLDGAMPHVGDEVVLDLAARPGIDVGDTPTSQRGLAQQCLVIGRTPLPTGYRLVLLAVPIVVAPPEDVGVGGSASGPFSLDFTLAKGAGSASSNTVLVTLDDGTGWDGWEFLIEYLVDPPYTPTATTPGSLWYQRLQPTGATSITPLPSGSTVWVRISAFGIGSYTAWQSIVLDSASSNAGNVIVQTPTVQLTVDGSGDVDVTVNAGAETVKVYAAADDVSFPGRATILAGSTDTTDPYTFNNIINIDAGEIAYVGAIAEDSRGNKSIAAYAAIQRSPNVEESLSVTFTGGISANDVRDLQVPYDCTVLGWAILGTISGSITVDIWRDTVANFPPTDADSITGTGTPAVSSATSATGNTTGWGSTTLNKDDILRFNVDSVTSFTQVTVSLTVRRT